MEKAIHISVKYSSEAIWSHTYMEEYDKDASEKNYTAAVENALYAEYPEATIEVENAGLDEVLIDGRNDHEETVDVIRLEYKVWNGNDWLVA